VPETQRQPVPRNDAGEADTAIAFLSFARHCLIKKTEGLSEEQLRRVMVPTGTSLLGLIWHSIDGERFWFGYQLAGQGVDDYDFSMEAPADISAPEVLGRYREAIAASDEILAGLTSLDRPMTVPIDGRAHTARWVVAHMTSETARHAGHADILRELIDGVTGASADVSLELPCDASH
jgi:uncharacterized damage-inducible protein DinB